MIGLLTSIKSTWIGVQTTTIQLTESVNTAQGGVSPPTVIATHREWLDNSIMTALNIRKNLASILHGAADAVLEVKKPNHKEIRRKIANAIMPKN